MARRRVEIEDVGGVSVNVECGIGILGTIVQIRYRGLWLSLTTIDYCVMIMLGFSYLGLVQLGQCGRLWGRVGLCRAADLSKLCPRQMML
jgi:hypothetical protein